MHKADKYYLLMLFVAAAVCVFVSIVLNHMNKSRIALVLFPVIYGLPFLVFQVPNLLRKGDARFMGLAIASFATSIVIGLAIIMNWPERL